MKFRKKPVVIEAKQLTPETAEEIGAWCGARKCVSGKYNSYLWGWALPIEERHIRIDTPEGEHSAGMGDWIIRGVMGEFYPCKDEIFKLINDSLEDAA